MNRNIPKIAVFIHAALLNRCRDRLIQFFNIMVESKLIDNIDNLFINFVGEDDFPVSYQDFFPFSDKVVLNRISNNLLDYELPTLSHLYDYSILNPYTKILYIHTKSIGTDINFCIEDQIYYMLFFLISKWQICVEQLNYFNTVGVDLRNDPVLHYSGNFWWASACHIAKLPDPRIFNNLELFPNLFNSARHNPKFWVCYNSNDTIHKSLWDSEISCSDKHFEFYPKDLYINKPFITKNRLHLSKYNSCNDYYNDSCNDSIPYISTNQQVCYHSFGKYENIISYKYGFNFPKICLEQVIFENFDYNIDQPSIYFIFDNQGQDALAHWVYESFIFFPIFLEVQKIHPNIKILTSNKKKYVKNMFKLIGIDAEIVYDIYDYKNICYFHPTISINSDMKLEITLINTYLFFYIETIQSLLVDFGTKYNLVYFPRNSKDNFAYNIVDILGQDDFEKAIIDFGGTVVNTFQINNIHLQLLCLYNSDIIIVDFGSSSLFNLIFLTGKTIFILDNRKWFDYQYNRLEFNRIHHDIICSNNTVFVIKQNDNGIISFDDIKPFLTNH